MARKPGSQHPVRKNHNVWLPITKEEYPKMVLFPSLFRQWIVEQSELHPELFPTDLTGFQFKDIRTSRKLKIVYRRILLKDKNLCTIRPAFVLPYMTAFTDDVSDLLFLSRWVPVWALAHVFHIPASKIYRIITSFGRNSIVETTVKTTEIPEHLLADEYHTTRSKEKSYIATTVGEGCVLGSEFCESATGEALTEGYSIFKTEVLEAEPEYHPKTVNTDGWKGTQQAWHFLFPLCLLIRCFLHAWLRIRDRSKNRKEQFFEIGNRVWSIYRAKNKESMLLKIQELCEWAGRNLSGVVKEKVLDLCTRTEDWTLHYENEKCHRTSNMLDRVMRSQNKYFERGQGFHGSVSSSKLRCRAWAILYNYWEWCPRSRHLNAGHRCPAERLNDKRYADDWLQNLIVATSNRKKKRPPNLE
jgi:hypothetical protein